MKKLKNKNSGFTLIETIIYIALFSLLLGTAFVTVYQLIDGSNTLSSKNTTASEADFVMRKIDWALTGIDPATIPVIGGSGCARTLSIYKTDTAVSPIVVRLNNVDGINYIEIQKNSGTFYPITTENVSVSCLQFSLTSSDPSGFIATATIDGILFSTTKYIRQ